MTSRLYNMCRHFYLLLMVNIEIIKIMRVQEEARRPTLSLPSQWKPRLLIQPTTTLKEILF